MPKSNCRVMHRSTALQEEKPETPLCEACKHFLSYGILHQCSDIQVHSGTIGTVYSTPTITKSNPQDNFLQLPVYFMKLHTTHTQQTLPATPQLHVTSPKLLTSIALIWCMHSLQSCSHKFELGAHGHIQTSLSCFSVHLDTSSTSFLFALLLHLFMHAHPGPTVCQRVVYMSYVCRYTICSLCETTLFCCVELRVPINSLHILSLFIRILVGLKQRQDQLSDSIKRDHISNRHKV